MARKNRNGGPVPRRRWLNRFAIMFDPVMDALEEYSERRNGLT